MTAVLESMGTLSILLFTFESTLRCCAFKPIPHFRLRVSCYGAIPSNDYLESLSTESNDVRLERTETSASYVNAMYNECNVDGSSRSCAIAITSYLDALSSGVAEPATEAAWVISSYLDSLAQENSLWKPGTSSDAVKSYLDTLSSGSTAVPSVEAVLSYFDTLSTGEVSSPSSAAAIASNLNVHSNMRSARGFDVTKATHTHYLHDISEECNANGSLEKCAAAIESYFRALSTGVAEPAPEPAWAISSYLDSISRYNEVWTQEISSSVAVRSYLDALSSGSTDVPSADAIVSYFHALSAGEVSTPSSAAAIASNLNSYLTGECVQRMSSSSASSLSNGISGTAKTTASYLDAISEECNVSASSRECGTAISSYLDALSHGVVKPTPEAATVISTYVDSQSHGSWMQGTSSGVAVESYLDSLSSGSTAVPSADAVVSYLDALSTGKETTPSSAKAIASNLAASSRPYADSIVVDSTVEEYDEDAASSVHSGEDDEDVRSSISGSTYLDTLPPRTDAFSSTVKSTRIGAISDGNDLAHSVTTLSSKHDMLDKGNTIKPASTTAATSSSYLDTISKGGSTLPEHLRATTTTSYLDALSTENVSPSRDAITSYVDSLSSGEKSESFSRETSRMAATSYLDSLSGGAAYSPMALPLTSSLKATSADKVTFPINTAGSTPRPEKLPTEVPFGVRMSTVDSRLSQEDTKHHMELEFEPALQSKTEDALLPVAYETRKPLLAPFVQNDITPVDTEPILAITKSRTQRIMEKIAASRQVLGARSDSTYKSFLRAEKRWSELQLSSPFVADSMIVQNWQGGVPPPPTLVTDDESKGNPECWSKLLDVQRHKRDLDYDVVVCGGTLGIFVALALQVEGYKVCVLDVGKQRGRQRKWSISRKELDELLSLGILTLEEIGPAVTAELAGWEGTTHGGYDKSGRGFQFTPNILSLLPTTILKIASDKFKSLGGVIKEVSSIKEIVVAESLAVALDVSSSNSDEPITSRLVFDCMGNVSPISAQSGFRMKPDGVCAVVGSYAGGFDSETDQFEDSIWKKKENQSEKKSEKGKTRCFLEVSPIGFGRDRDRERNGGLKTTYMFTYMGLEKKRPSLATLMEDYWHILPMYEPSISDPEKDLDVKRVYFSCFPTYPNSPLTPKWSRILTVGDAMKIHVCLSMASCFCS